VGASVTITGTNFSATTGNNTVYFGATKATVTAATSTELTVTVPIGATFGPISVQVANRTVISKQFFVPTFTGTGPTFDLSNLPTKVDFTAPSGPYDEFLGDVDGDGKADLISVNYGSSNLSIFRNISTTGVIDGSSFDNPVNFSTGTGPVSLAFGDLDGDGKPDLTVVNLNASTMSVFRNTSMSGTVSFADSVNFATTNPPRSVAIGDLDGDGKPDIAVANDTA
jgi:hypothetical protein